MDQARRPPSSETDIAAATVGQPRRVDGPIVLADPDPGWPSAFEDEAHAVRAVLGHRVLELHHVGSTAVAGLAAKPIIDMILAVADSADEATYVPPMEAAGYVLRIREPDWHEHRLFKGPNRDINLHVFSRGDPEIRRMVLFRDVLRSDRHALERYQATKRDLASRHWEYVQQYADAKDHIIDTILAEADWSA